MTVKQYLLDRIAKGTIHMALIDPDKQPAEEAGRIAKRMKDAGTDAVMIGGSTGVTTKNLTVKDNHLPDSGQDSRVQNPFTQEFENLTFAAGAMLRKCTYALASHQGLISVASLR